MAPTILIRRSLDFCLKLLKFQRALTEGKYYQITLRFKMQINTNDTKNCIHNFVPASSRQRTGKPSLTHFSPMSHFYTP